MCAQYRDATLTFPGLSLQSIEKVRLALAARAAPAATPGVQPRSAPCAALPFHSPDLERVFATKTSQLMLPKPHPCPIL